MKKEKEYGKIKIVSLDGSTVYKHSLHLFGLSDLPVYRAGVTRALVNVCFDHAVKLFAQYGRRYMRYRYSVTDEDMNRHVCVRYENGSPVLVAVEVPYDKDKEENSTSEGVMSLTEKTKKRIV